MGGKRGDPRKASDWLLHHHDSDKAYDSVILHVTGVNDASICRMNGEPIPSIDIIRSGTCPEKYRLVIGKRGARPLPRADSRCGLRTSGLMDGCLAR